MRRFKSSFGVPKTHEILDNARGVGGQRRDLAQSNNEPQAGMQARIYNPTSVKSLVDDPRYDAKPDNVENIYWPAKQSQEIKRKDDFLTSLAKVFGK